MKRFLPLVGLLLLLSGFTPKPIEDDCQTCGGWVVVTLYHAHPNFNTAEAERAATPVCVGNSGGDPGCTATLIHSSPSYCTQWQQMPPPWFPICVMYRTTIYTYCYLNGGGQGGGGDGGGPHPERPQAEPPKRDG